MHHNDKFVKLLIKSHKTEPNLGPLTKIMYEKSKISLSKADLELLLIKIDEKKKIKSKKSFSDKIKKI